MTKYLVTEACIMSALLKNGYFFKLAVIALNLH